MQKVTPIRKPIDPRGRVDVLLCGLVEASVKLLVRPRSEALWDVLRPHVQVVAKKQIRRLGITQRPLTAEELELIERYLSPRRMKCTA